MRARPACIVFSGLLLIAGCNPGRTRKPLQDNSPPAPVASSSNAAGKSSPTSSRRTEQMPSLSPASELMIKACDNYLAISRDNPKIPEVLLIKASVLYNNKLYARSREVYRSIIDHYPTGPEAMNATRMIAQGFYEEKAFDSAQAWFRTMSEQAGDGQDRQEALARIAESIFKKAEAFESEQNFKEAAAGYERVALEFPESKIADVALYNAGLAYEKLAEWSRAILVLQRMIQRYPESKLLSRARFRTAKCFEKLLQWDNAAEMYLRVVANHPHSEQAPAALYNAGFCFENAGKPTEAGTAFEKLAQLYPKSEDAPDVLFKAGELYGKVKDWAGVTRVNQEFNRRFGNDAERAIQAQCMIGIALYMQDRRDEAVSQLQRTVAAAGRLKNPSPVNSNYAAKAQFTLAEIAHEDMKKIVLPQGKAAYRRALDQKRTHLESAVRSYSQVVRYGIMEWTSRSIFQMGQIHEDFALGIMRQERSDGVSFEEQFALELGIAKAVEEYFVQHALPFHERNVKLGIDERSEDKYITMSRRKLTYLPYLSGENYLALVAIFEKTRAPRKIEGFALIADKLEVLQKIAPFQERAIELFKTGLEMGSRYRETDEFYKKASAQITRTALSVGQTYADVASVAREAPIPAGFDPYEMFVYKTKLLTQIAGYEDQAYGNFLKTLKIAEAYSIQDEFVLEARRAIPRVLFIRGRCYDLLALQALTSPPFPSNVHESEKPEYRARFEEAGLKLQDQAVDVYRTILELAEKEYAVGDDVTHAYVRLYQLYPEEYGRQSDHIDSRSISAGPHWRCSGDSLPEWYRIELDDSSWPSAQASTTPAIGIRLKHIPDSSLRSMWCGSGQHTTSAVRVYFRSGFIAADETRSAQLSIAGVRWCAIFVNGHRVHIDTGMVDTILASRQWNVAGHLRRGKNTVAISVVGSADPGVFVHLALSARSKRFLPHPPGSAQPLDPDSVSEQRYRFMPIKNFSPDLTDARVQP